MKNRAIFCIMVFALLLSFSRAAIAEAISCSATTDTQFVPSWGKVDVGEDQYSRYIYQWMYWHTPTRLQWLITNGDSTFEPDALFYDYDGTAYGNAPSGYWASDLPDPYVDTQVGDIFDENAVTVGSGRAVMLTSGKVYYTVTRMTNGGGNSSWLKLSSQRGRQWPTGCTTTWCSYGCSANNNYFTIPFTDHFTAPGCQQYWWQWDATVRGTCN